MAEFEEVTQAATEERLASRGERFAAAVIDIVISILASLPFFFYTGLEALENPDMTLVVTGLVYSILIYIVINGYLLFHFGQTVGKRFLNIRIEDLQDRQAGLGRILLMRFLPVQVVTNMPFIGGILGLINIAFIFRKDHRCVHDHIAGTRVCRVPDELRV